LARNFAGRANDFTFRFFSIHGVFLEGEGVRADLIAITPESIFARDPLTKTVNS